LYVVFTVFESPVGPLLLAGEAHALQVLAFAHGRSGTPDPSWLPDTAGVLDPVRRELDSYFDGELREFRVPLAPRGTTFQESVWRSLRDIPYGETISYGELARRVGDPRAVRAVGAANGANPIAIIVPCHRVIGANGSLIGFGGGLPIKRALLDLERGERRLL
jgi:methylated-DNA-[protein]-cysteine S-methyltransferase